MKINELPVCPRCGAEWKSTIAMNGGESEFWKECSNPKCNTYFNTYMPQAHQAKFHTDQHRFKANFGGYGSGKTLTSREELYKHIFLTPRGNGLIGANVTSQYEQTIRRELENDIPVAFIKKVSTLKSYIDFKNDYRLMFRPFDDPDKLRSYNVDMFIILEASEVKRESFTQLKTRLRNSAAMLQKTDSKGEPIFRTAQNGAQIPLIAHNWLEGIIESNPDAGWIKSDVLQNSSDIYKHGEVLDDFEVNPTQADPMISTHITSTSANEFLPKDFIAQNTQNKPLWWINRYIYGSFLYAEGLVYPSARNHIIEPFDIPPTWKRMIAFDYGLSDPSAFIFAAIDEKENRVVIYKEERTKDKNVEQLAELFHSASKDIPMGGLWIPPLIDPKSGPKRDYEKKTLSDHFLEFGIAFQPGQINVDARILKLNTYLESGKLQIFNTCVALNKELANYKFKRDDDTESGFTGKPEDKNNHSINALEWIVMELPNDPSNLMSGVYNKAGELLDARPKDDKQLYAFSALSDENEDFYTEIIEETPFGVSLL